MVLGIIIPDISTGPCSFTRDMTSINNDRKFAGEIEIFAERNPLTQLLLLKLLSRNLKHLRSRGVLQPMR